MKSSISPSIRVVGRHVNEIGAGIVVGVEEEQWLCCTLLGKQTSGLRHILSSGHVLSSDTLVFDCAIVVKPHHRKSVCVPHAVETALRTKMLLVCAHRAFTLAALLGLRVSPTLSLA